MSQLEATFTPEVGSTVRVLLADGLRRERALVLTVGDNGDVEVLTTGPPETELVVPLESAEPLEPFEGAKQGPGCARADEDAVAFVERLKEEAKVLYGKKDFAAASQWYRTAIKALETHVSWRPTGSSSDTAGSKLVLVKVGGTLRAAEVLAVRSEDRALVSFLEASGNAASSDSKNGATAGILSHPNSGAGCDFDESDELEVVRGSDIVSTVCSSTELRAIACALRLNSARCELSLSRAVDKAIWDCAVVLRMAALPLPSSSSSSSSSSSPAWDHIATQATAHVLRGKAHLALVDDAKVVCAYRKERFR